MPQLDIFSYWVTFINFVILLGVMYFLCNFILLPIILRNVFVKKRVMSSESFWPRKVMTTTYYCVVSKCYKNLSLMWFKLDSVVWFSNYMLVDNIVVGYEDKVKTECESGLWSLYLCSYLVLLFMANKYDSKD